MSTTDNKKQEAFFDINKVLKEKNPSLQKKIPGFAIRWFEKFICIDALNHYMAVAGHKKGVEFSDEIIQMNNLKIELKGVENIPKEGRFTFASNHPLGGLDGIILCGILGKHYPDFLFLVNDILMNIPPLTQFFLPINKHGGQAKDSAKIINDAYASNRQIALFPAGLVSRKSKNGIKDLEWKKNFITKSVQHKRDIIPLHMTGQNSKQFYRIARLRKLFGIKINIEMLKLGCEVSKFRNQKITITLGKPINYKSLDKSKTPIQWAEFVKNATYNLAKK